MSAIVDVSHGEMEELLPGLYSCPSVGAESDGNDAHHDLCEAVGAGIVRRSHVMLEGPLCG